MQLLVPPDATAQTKRRIDNGSVDNVAGLDVVSAFVSLLVAPEHETTTATMTRPPTTVARTRPAPNVTRTVCRLF